MPLLLSLTERGFARAEFKDRYGAECSIQESSLADEACIWLGVDMTMEGRPNNRMHLTREMVRDLMPMLQHFVETGELPASAD